MASACNPGDGRIPFVAGNEFGCDEGRFEQGCKGDKLGRVDDEGGSFVGCSGDGVRAGWSGETGLFCWVKEGEALQIPGEAGMLCGVRDGVTTC